MATILSSGWRDTPKENKRLIQIGLMGLMYKFKMALDPYSILYVNRFLFYVCPFFVALKALGKICMQTNLAAAFFFLLKLNERDFACGSKRKF